MKKQHIKPQMRAYDIKMTQILCVSGDEPLGAPCFDWDDWNDVNA